MEQQQQIGWAIERLRELRAEYANGEMQALELDERRMQLRESMLRIGGAIQVLDELIEQSGAFATRESIVTNGEAKIR
jgi:hypothetical protein